MTFTSWFGNAVLHLYDLFISFFQAFLITSFGVSACAVRVNTLCSASFLKGVQLLVERICSPEKSRHISWKGFALQGSKQGSN